MGHRSAHSTAEFRVPNFWGLAKVKGHFDRIDGWLEIDDVGSRRLELKIDATTVNTGNHKRDEHLRQPTSLTPNDTPTCSSSQATSATPRTDISTCRGELLAGGDRVALDLRLTMRQADDRFEVDASATVDQRQLGMTWNPLGIVRTPTVLTVYAHLRPR